MAQAVEVVDTLYGFAALIADQLYAGFIGYADGHQVYVDSHIDVFPCEVGHIPVALAADYPPSVGDGDIEIVAVIFK